MGGGRVSGSGKNIEKQHRGKTDNICPNKESLRQLWSVSTVRTIASTWNRQTSIHSPGAANEPAARQERDLVMPG